MIYYTTMIVNILLFIAGWVGWYKYFNTYIPDKNRNLALSSLVSFVCVLAFHTIVSVLFLIILFMWV